MTSPDTHAAPAGAGAPRRSPLLVGLSAAAFLFTLTTVTVSVTQIGQMRAGFIFARAGVSEATLAIPVTRAAERAVASLHRPLHLLQFNNRPAGTLDRFAFPYEGGYWDNTAGANNRYTIEGRRGQQVTFTLAAAPPDADVLLRNSVHSVVTLTVGLIYLGLPSSKRWVEEAGGSLSIQSEVGKGTSVVVRLPA